MTIDSNEITRRSYTFIFLMTYHQLNSTQSMFSGQTLLSCPPLTRFSAFLGAGFCKCTTPKPSDPLDYETSASTNVR
jgi:hypothetical protein